VCFWIIIGSFNSSPFLSWPLIGCPPIQCFGDCTGRSFRSRPFSLLSIFQPGSCLFSPDDRITYSLSSASLVSCPPSSIAALRVPPFSLPDRPHCAILAAKFVSPLLSPPNILGLWPPCSVFLSNMTFLGWSIFPLDCRVFHLNSPSIQPL